MRRALVIAVCLLAVAAIASTAGSASSAAGPGVSLQITFDVRGTVPLHYTLNCEPTSGTLANASAACRAIAANPKMVLGEPERPGPRPLKAMIACPAPHRTLELTGSYHGTAVHTSGDDTCSFNHVLSAWLPLLPTGEYLNEVRVDRGLEALQLGQTRASVTALLQRPTTRAGGAYVYRSETTFLEDGVAVALTVAFDKHHRVSTLIANDSPSVEWRWPLTLQPKAPSPLRHWHSISCAGRRSLADHRLTRHRATTIVWPSGDRPTAIVTSQPFRACRIAKATEQAPLAPGQPIH